MNLALHGSLGDFVLATGLPEAYYNVFGEKTFIVNKKFSELWNDNPYLIRKPSGGTFVIPTIISGRKKDYYPITMFELISNIKLRKDDTYPKIYTKFNKRRKRIIINDQAGWPSRRGYYYLNDLAKTLVLNGYDVVYLRNDNFRDCYGQQCHHQLSYYSVKIVNPNNCGLIYLLGESNLYIGYESGLTHLASACGTSYITIQSCVEPFLTNHPNCILSLGFCKEYCYSESCSNNCLYSNKNYLIIDCINKFFQ